MNSDFVRRIFIGMVLILIGALFLGSQLGFIHLDASDIASTYWPVIIIILGISGLLNDLRNRNHSGGSLIWNLFIIALGAGFLGRNLDMLHISIGELVKLLIPACIIIFGIRMMFRKDTPTNRHNHNQSFGNKYEYNYEQSSEPIEATSTSYSDPTAASPKREDHFHYGHSHMNDHVHSSSTESRNGFFGDLHLGHDYWVLKPMNISHFIGDTIIDLTKAQIPLDETKLNISAFIGDVKVFVPNDMEVEVSVASSSFIGDISIFSKNVSGFMRSLNQESTDYMISDKKIRLQINLFIGDIIVKRVG